MFRRTRTATSKLTNRISKWGRFSRLSLQHLEDRSVPATFVVTSLADAGAGSLREAVGFADLSADPTDTVDASALSGTILLASSILVNEASDVTILGPGGGLLTVDGNNAVRLFNIQGSSTAAVVTFKSITLSKGKAAGSGGAILSDDQALFLNNCVVTGNAGTGDGGAIYLGYPAGSLTIDKSTLSNNSTTTDGGAIGISGDSPVVITNSTLSGNKASSAGGAIYFFSGGSLDIESCTLSGNVSSGFPGGGGIYFFGTVSGGGFTVTNSTISGNTATGNSGGGVVFAYFTGNAAFENSTITNNTATGLGGGGLAITGGLGTISLSSTIVAQNTNATAADISLSAAGSIAGDNNLVGAADTGNFTLTGVGNLTGTQAAPLNAKLGGLANNGGPTQTHVPILTSPAVDAGNNVLGLTTDQRGGPRVINGGIGATADIGAVEVDPNIPSASGTFGNVVVGGATTHPAQIVYTDKTSIKISTLDNADIRITGPGGFNVLATFKAPSVPGTGAAMETANYEFTPPGGSWDGADNGTYTVSVELMQVSNGGGNFVPAGSLGTFAVAIPVTYLVDEVSDVDDGLVGAGQLSIREAIKAANLDTAPSVINFDAAAFAGTKTISLTAGEMAITEGVSISGPAGGLILDAKALSRIFNVNPTTGGDAVSISNMTATNGKVAGSNGGGIFNDDAALTLTNVIVSNSSTDFDGGGISVFSGSGSLILIDSSVSNNTATGSFSNGGGINLSSSSAVTVTRTTVSGNQAGEDGGGIYFFSGGSLKMDDSTVSGNVANISTASAGGGGIYLFATTTVIRNSTISGNTAKGSGGGIAVLAGSVTTIKNSTIAFNATTGNGGGIGGGVATLNSVIVANNTATGTGPDVNGPVNADYSLFSNSAGATITGANNVENLPANLAPLSNYGGPTLTHGLLTGSNALNVGNNADALANDQRGAGFPRKVGTAVDIGSFEGIVTSPTGALTPLGPIIVAGPTPNSVEVIYSDDVGIDAAKIDTGDIQILSPALVSLAITGVVYTPAGMGGSAVYTFTVPGGAWDGGDNGKYTVNLLANQVYDTDPVPNSALPSNLGSFLVGIPVVYLVDEVSDVDDADLSVGKLSFREAIKASNGDFASSIINFDATAFAGTKTITMAAGQLSITDGVTINGPAGGLVLDANALSRVFNIDPTTAGSVVTISNMTATNGKATAANGGGVLNVDAILTLTNVTVSNNTTDGEGGGISVAAAAGSLNLILCKVTDNTATGSFSNGGGIHISTNSAVTLSQTTVSGNQAGEDGGGIYFFSGGTLAMDDSTVSGNSSNTITAGAGGGGIYLFNTPTTIRNSTISGNSSKGNGGGISIPYGVGATVKNSTIAFNSTTGNGGGINGVKASTLDSVIVANNTAGGTGPDVNGAVNADYTLISNDSGATITGANNVLNLSANLTSLGNFGGPTQTHALLSGSGAINVGNNADALANDQRGSGFPRLVGAAVDIGSFEGVLANPSGVLMPLGPVITAGATPNTVVVTYSDDVGIDASKIDAGDIEILNPALAPLTITGVVFTPAGTGGKAVYTFTVPGGAWDIADNGKYTVNLLANQVFDIDLPTPNTAFAGNLGSFLVAIPVFYVVDEVSDLDDGIVTAGKLSFREAIKAANSDAVPSVINFDAAAFAGTKTITMSSGVMAINAGVTVNGPAGGLVLDAATLSRVFDTSASPSASVIAISKMTLTNGSSTGSGGAILVGDEALSLTNVTVSKSTAAFDGGGISVSSGAGSLTLTDCIIDSNSATGVGASGGGINFDSGSVVTIARTTLSGNTAVGNGGGINFGNGGKLTMTASTLSGNNANTGDANLGGGGIHFYGGGSGASLSLVNCTISGNSAAGLVNGYGGGIICNYFNGSLTLTACTVTNNSSTKSGGGIASTGGTTTLNSSIISGNIDPVAPDIFMYDPYGPVDIGGDNNLIGVADVGNFTLTGAGNLTGFLAAPLDAKLAPLASNGGPTKTHALLPSSPALDAGNNVAGLASDQRGPGYVRVFGAAADIGAFEEQPLVAAKVTNVSINSKLLTLIDKAQRSYVSDVAITFDSIVSFTGTAAAAFTLDKVGGGSVTLAANVDNTGPGTVVTLTFTGGSVNATSLADGRYALHVLSAGVTGGLFGGLDFIFDEAASPAPLDTSKIFRIFGDYEGDGDVDTADFIQFRLALGNSAPPFQLFDFDNDGAVATSDFIQFRLRFGGAI